MSNAPGDMDGCLHVDALNVGFQRAHRPACQRAARVVDLFVAMRTRAPHLFPAGFIIVGVFVVTWVVALAVWRFGDIEQKWERQIAESHAEASASFQD